MLLLCCLFLACCRQAGRAWGQFWLAGLLLAVPVPGPAQTGGRPLPHALTPLLPPQAARGAADVARQRIDHAHRPTDSLGRLLVYVRRAQAFRTGHRPDSAAHYLGRAWKLVSARQGQQQPVVVIKLADDLAGLHYARGSYDSTLYYYQQAARQFRAAGLDSTVGPAPATAPTAGSRWPEGAPLPGILANAGSACRALGRLPLALHYYGRARNLFRQQGNLSGIGWTQCLLGETYAAQGLYPQAEQAYEQAIATYRRYGQQPANQGPAGGALADVLVSYYLPLLLEGHSRRPAAYASTLAAEADSLLQMSLLPAELRTYPNIALLLTRLNLVPAQVALQAGAPAAAAPGWAAPAPGCPTGLRPTQQWPAGRAATFPTPRRGP
ncbi:tetratricopeptide repeat protein [Hymenobacter sp. J193]|uniref:tetratricopeptide repeat protein n=1 Tax=Hymenobacter sp. J193 TaxID=2898429 RepID=UPI0021506CFD|nr:tetratricopeptide repeat protein [Hymenobacter sp. J193]MCR5887795.1 tetratricopeptide repeat protein [Hymenobacter sp. J193]